MLRKSCFKIKFGFSNVSLMATFIIAFYHLYNDRCDVMIMKMMLMNNQMGWHYDSFNCLLFVLITDQLKSRNYVLLCFQFVSERPSV